MALKRIRIGPAGADWKVSATLTKAFAPGSVVAVPKSVADEFIAQSRAVPVSSGGSPKPEKE
jgi:hypothetical protein